VLEDERHLVAWRGSRAVLERPGAEVENVIEIFEQAGSLWRRRTWRLRERHYPLRMLERMLGAAGLSPLATIGQRRGGMFDGSADESRHHKAVVVAGIRDQATYRKERACSGVHDVIAARPLSTRVSPLFPVTVADARSWGCGVGIDALGPSLSTL
jgi:hypothetical protein